MHFIGPLALIVGALVCLSSFIIAKNPAAKDLFDKIAPYQGFLGVGLLAWGFYDLYTYVISDWAGSGKSLWGLAMANDKLIGLTMIGYIVCEILIGFMLGFGLIATWIPGEGAAEKGAVKVQKKLLAFSLPIGVVGIVCAIISIVKYPA